MNSPDRNDSDATQTIFLSGPQSLARILAQDEPDAALWEPQEMRAMWQHQMRAPIEADLAALRASRPGRFSDVAGGEDKSFADVLQTPKAPLALLKLIKEIAKQMLKEAEDAQLKELAAALYYTSYAAALLRHGQRLGGMSEPELRGGFEWALGRVWLDEATKGLLRAARESLDS